MSGQTGIPIRYYISKLPGHVRLIVLLLFTQSLAIIHGCGENLDNPIDENQDYTFSMGVTVSPRGHTATSTNQDWIDHYSGHVPWGRIIAFHSNWRDDVESAGQIPTLAMVAETAANQYGFTPAIGLGWAGGSGDPDLTSESDPQDNSWNNQETRVEFLSMVTAFAREHQPPFLFLGNETNIYYRSHTAAEWELWLSEYSACYDSIKAVSANTVVFTTFQYELLKGVGRYNGWNNPVNWQPVDDLVEMDRVDALGFTSYPYFEYDTPVDIPEDYYDEIAEHWDGPVIFTEIGWLGGQSTPYPGGEEAQAQFISQFFKLSKNLELRYVTWLFLHDWDGQDNLPAFRFIGLRENDGTPRPADVAWQNEVAARE
jgi:hypothetical protein